MKKRLGFVSNSSSSSFIIIFDKEPQNAEDVKGMLFPNTDVVAYYDYNISSNVASDIIFRDIAKADIDTLGRNFEELIYAVKYYGSGEEWLIDSKDEDLLEFLRLDDEVWGDWEKWKALPQDEKDKIEEEKQTVKERVLKKMFDNFNRETKDKFVYTAEFSDNDGEIYCTLEHGEVFEKVKHIRISNH